MVTEIPPRSVGSPELICPYDGQHPGGRAGHGSCRQECLKAAFGGATAAISNVWSAPHGARLSKHGVGHSRTEQMEATSGPPSPDEAAPPRVPGDGNICTLHERPLSGRLNNCVNFT